jgi:linoleoyl-CoA desaturase
MARLAQERRDVMLTRRAGVFAYMSAWTSVGLPSSGKKEPEMVSLSSGSGLDVASKNPELGVLACDDAEARSEAFAKAIDALKQEFESSLGEQDVEHLRRVTAFSKRMELVGRGLLHFSVEPLGFTLGVAALWVHKTLELMEIGHTVLHGTYDHLAGPRAYRTETFRWKAPIDESSWRSAHNIRHHQYTNIAGRDPDLDFGGIRLSAHIPFRQVHRLQPLTVLWTWTGFAAAINMHASGALEFYAGRAKSKSFRELAQAHKRAFRKYVPYYAREYVFFPLLAGPLFWKTLAGNVLSELGRDLYAGATIYCGHVEATKYPSGSRARGRGRWYIMQVEGAHNFEVPLPLSILCGALNLQIEHHLFPRLPPNRLREIAPRVKALCEAHGVRYQTASWPRTLRGVFRSLRALSSPALAEVA